MIRFIAPTVAIIATLAVIAVASSGLLPTSAQTDPVVSMDAISDTNNNAAAVGTIDTCLSTSTGAIFNVDVVIQVVTNIAGFQANLLYNPAVLKVTAVDYNYLLTTTLVIPPDAVLPLGSSTPDTDGDFFMAAAMYSTVSVTGASGDGVMARVTLEAVGSGISQLDLTSVKLADDNGNPIPPSDDNKFYIGPVNDAWIVVDTACGSQDTDGDTIIDSEDPDDDGDGYWDDDETDKGSNPLNASSTPEHCDGVDNDGDTEMDEEPAGADWDIDGDTVKDCLDSDVFGADYTVTTDDDGDGHMDVKEQGMSTDELSGCPTDKLTTKLHDAWPPDRDHDGDVDVGDVIAAFLGKILDAARYDARSDADADGDVDIGDVIFLYLGTVLTSC